MSIPTRVAYLSYDGLTDPLGQSQILPYLCGLSREAYQITIISFEKEDRFAKEKGNVASLCSQYQLQWMPLRYHKFPPVFSTVYDLFQLRRVVLRLNRQNHFSIIHCRSYLTALVGMMMKKRFGIKFIFDMRGFWADERVEGGLWNLKNPVYKFIYAFFKKKEKQFIQHADIIVSLTENAKNEMLNWNLNRNIRVIPCCVDVEHFDPVKINETKKNLLRNELGIREGDFVLLYLGSLGTWYLLDDMLKFFSILKKAKPSARFLLITPDKLAGMENNRDIIVKQSNREDVPLFISMSDLAIVFIKPSFSKKASSATKMAEVLSMGKPVVINSGWGDIEPHAKVIPGLLTISRSNDFEAVIGSWPPHVTAENIRAGAIEHFSLARGVALYRKIYQDLM